jgi:hypothetical protein
VGVTVFIGSPDFFTSRNPPLWGPNHHHQPTTKTIMMRRSTISLLIVLGQQLFQTSHGFAPHPIVGHTTRRPLTLPVSSSSNHHHDATRQQSLSSSSDGNHHHETPITTTTSRGGGVWVKDCRTAIVGLAVGCLLVFSPAADCQAAATTTTPPPGMEPNECSKVLCMYQK